MAGVNLPFEISINWTLTGLPLKNYLCLRLSVIETTLGVYTKTIIINNNYSMTWRSIVVDIEFCVLLNPFCSFAYTCLITSALANRHMLKLALFTCEIHIIIILIVISKITFNNNY